MSEFETGGSVKNGLTLRVFDVPDYTTEIIKLKEEGPTQETILKIIEKHSGHRARMLKNYDRYKTNSRGIPIFSRKLERDVTTDRKLNLDYFSEIVDIKTGYFAGNAASYSYDKETPEVHDSQGTTR
ncbi:phage portal protein [Exiguobacterium sp. SL14]|nr:phage portal protein [Exiguobacterium sp. SL14]MCY1690726.1 phage portal protein [Exiguobacterium sp. SL14]